MPKTGQSDAAARPVARHQQHQQLHGSRGAARCSSVAVAAAPKPSYYPAVSAFLQVRGLLWRRRQQSPLPRERRSSVRFRQAAPRTRPHLRRRELLGPRFGASCWSAHQVAHQASAIGQPPYYAAWFSLRSSPWGPPDPGRDFFADQDQPSGLYLKSCESRAQVVLTAAAGIPAFSPPSATGVQAACHSRRESS